MTAQATDTQKTPTRRRWLPLVRYLLVTLLALGLIAYWMWSSEEEQRAIRDMPTSERHALYERTLQNLTLVCTGSDAVHLKDFCQKEADLILLFPECDTHCQDLAGRLFPRAVR